MEGWEPGRKVETRQREVQAQRRWPRPGLTAKSPSLLPLLPPLMPFPPQEAKPPYLNELLGGGEAAHAERHEDPAPGIAALGGVVSKLLADLAVDLIPRQVGK